MGGGEEEGVGCWGGGGGGVETHCRSSALPDIGKFDYKAGSSIQNSVFKFGRS